jgi:hypothetical protein
MHANTARAGRGSRENSKRLHEFERSHQEEIEAISLIVAKITHRTLEEVKPYLDAMLFELVEPNPPAFDSQRWEADLKALAEGADSIPVLPSKAFTRESIYSDRD